MKKYFLALIVPIICSIGNNALAQDSEVKQTNSTILSNDEMGPLFLIDGCPIYSMDDLNKIDPQIITTINVSKDTLYDCCHIPIYSGLIIVTTKDSINIGLKFILNKTGNWILKHPLANYRLNGIILNQNSDMKKLLYDIEPKHIANLKIIDPKKDGTKCDNGILEIETK